MTTPAPSDAGATSPATRPLACSARFDRCRERYGTPIVVSRSDQAPAEDVGDVVAIDAQRLLVAYTPEGRRDVALATIDAEGAVTARTTLAQFDVRPRVTFHSGFATGILRANKTTTVLDFDGRPTVDSTLPNGTSGFASPVIPVSQGYLTWSESSNGGGVFFRTRASSRGLEWENAGTTPPATHLAIAHRAEGLPLSFLLSDGNGVSLYSIDDDGEPGLVRSGVTIASGKLLGAAETARARYVLVKSDRVDQIVLVELEADISSVTEPGPDFGDVIAIDDGSVVVATATGDGPLLLRTLSNDQISFAEPRTVTGTSSARRAQMMRMVLTRTGFAMTWIASGATSGELLLQRWDCCAEN